MLKRLIKLPVLKLNKCDRPVVWFLWTLFYLLWQERENTLFPHCLHSAAFIIHYTPEQICSEPPSALHHHQSAPSNMIDKNRFMSTMFVGASVMEPTILFKAKSIPQEIFSNTLRHSSTFTKIVQVSEVMEMHTFHCQLSKTFLMLPKVSNQALTPPDRDVCYP